MSVELTPVELHQKSVLRNLMQAYRHDLSEFTGDDIDHSGLYRLGSYFDAYWVESTRHANFILKDGKVAGFALIREFDPGCYEMAEFFILRKFRRTGVGAAAARSAFRRFAGKWRVAQDEGNSQASAFWRTVIGEFSGGQFLEGWSPEQPRGPMQTFESPFGSRTRTLGLSLPGEKKT